MNKKAFSWALLVLIGVGLPYLKQQRIENASKVVTFSGNIEFTEIEVSFKIPGKMFARYVNEGELVDKNAVVARLDPEELDQQVALRDEELHAAQAQLQEFQEGYQPEEIAKMSL